MNKQSENSLDARPVALSRNDLSAGLWSGKITFRHGQCDPAGIVYTPEFFNVFNQVIEDWFCSRLGINYYEVIGPRRTGIGYVNAAATFFAPCKMGDEVEIFVIVDKIGNKSYQLVLHAMLGDNEALRGYFTTVATSLDTHRPIPIPKDIREAMLEYSAEP
jgi:4-hydroxybenzoyl-CoA thioesterase/acyl-CoA thioester hydrolase